MEDLEPTTLLRDLELPVDPRWHDGRLWFSDLRCGRVSNVDPEGHYQVLFTLEGDWPGGLGFLSDGSLLCVSFWKRLLLRLDQGGPATYQDLTAIPVQGINDMTVGPGGRAYVATRKAAGVWPRSPTPEDGIILVEPGGSSRMVAEGLHHTDGMVITPDGKTFIVAECAGHRLTAFDIAVDGSLTNRHLFADLGDATPDGIALDAEGAVWVAAPITQEAFRVKQGGEVTHRLQLEKGRKPTSCALGGPNRKTLFLTTSFLSTPRTTAENPRAGFIETVPVDVPGVGWP